jgi:hypothetical protein
MGRGEAYLRLTTGHAAFKQGEILGDRRGGLQKTGSSSLMPLTLRFSAIQRP